MSIKITQPFEFNSQQPNFERDVINSSLFLSGNPLILSDTEQVELGENYDVGHIVWDINTRRHYRLEYSNSKYCFVAVEPLAKKTQDWYDMGDSYIPKLGEIIIFTDNRTDENGMNVPMFKIGDGIHNPSTLPFSSAGYAMTAGSADVAAKVAHKLHIGPHDYDGSADVTVGLYNGGYEVE